MPSSQCRPETVVRWGGIPGAPAGVIPLQAGRPDHRRARFLACSARDTESEHYTGRYDIMVADLTTQVAHLFSTDQGTARIC